jgi:hypothetical protein
MRPILILLLSLGSLLAGCSTTMVYRSGTSGTAATQSGGLSVNASVPGNTLAGAMLITILLADGVRQYLRHADGITVPYATGATADPARRVNVQDCTRPVDPNAGNLMCR